MKSFLEGFKATVAGNMAAQVLSKSVKSILFDIALFKVSWSGSTVSGRIVIEASMSSDKNEELFYELSDSEVLISTDSGEVEIIVKDMVHGLLRAKYVPTTGTGTINITANAKSIGR